MISTIKNMSHREKLGTFVGFLVADLTWGLWKHIYALPYPVNYIVEIPLFVLGGIFVAWGLVTYVFGLFTEHILFGSRPLAAFLISFAFTLTAFDFLYAILTNTLPL